MTPADALLGVAAYALIGLAIFGVALVDFRQTLRIHHARRRNAARAALLSPVWPIVLVWQLFRGTSAAVRELREGAK